MSFCTFSRFACFQKIIDQHYLSCLEYNKKPDRGPDERKYISHSGWVIPKKIHALPSSSPMGMKNTYCFYIAYLHIFFLFLPGGHLFQGSELHPSPPTRSFNMTATKPTSRLCPASARLLFVCLSSRPICQLSTFSSSTFTVLT